MYPTPISSSYGNDSTASSAGNDAPRWVRGDILFVVCRIGIFRHRQTDRQSCIATLRLPF